MAETTLDRKQTVFSLMFWMIVKIISWVMLGWLIVVLISGLLTLLMGNQEGLKYINYLLNGQIYYLSSMGNNYFAMIQLKFAISVTHFVYNWLFVKTHLTSYLQSFPSTGMFVFDRVIKTGSPVILTNLKIFIVTSELVLLRFTELLLSLLGVGLIICVGIIDGLVQRDIRKFSGGRESSLIYRRAKRIAICLIGFGFFIYLVIPLNIVPEVILLPMAILSSYMIMLSVKSFKKAV